MSDGINIDKEAFRRMNKTDQMVTLYENQVEMLKIAQRNQFHLKVQYVMIGILSTGVVILFKLHFKI